MSEGIIKIEYSHEAALSLGVGVRFISMRYVPNLEDGMAYALYSFPVFPGDLGYQEAVFEVQQSEAV